MYYAYLLRMIDIHKSVLRVESRTKMERTMKRREFLKRRKEPRWSDTVARLATAASSVRERTLRPPCVIHHYLPPGYRINFCSNLSSLSLLFLSCSTQSTDREILYWNHNILSTVTFSYWSVITGCLIGIDIVHDEDKNYYHNYLDSELEFYLKS